MSIELSLNDQAFQEDRFANIVDPSSYQELSGLGEENGEIKKRQKKTKQISKKATFSIVKKGEESEEIKGGRQKKKKNIKKQKRNEAKFQQRQSSKKSVRPGSAKKRTSKITNEAVVVEKKGKKSSDQGKKSSDHLESMICATNNAFQTVNGFLELYRSFSA